MHKHQDAFDKTRTTLLELGYSPEIIQLAFKEANSPSIDHLLDLLKSREPTYEYIIQRVNGSKPPKKSQNRKKSSCCKQEEDVKNEGNNQEGDDIRDKSNRRPLAVVENESQKQLEQVESAGKEQNGEKKSENKEPQLMDELTNKYVESIRYYLDRIRSKDPNWMIFELADQLKTLYFKTSEGAVRTRKYLEMPGHFPRLVELKHVVYSVIRRILDMKVKKKFRVNIEELSKGLTMAFELKLLKPSQMKITMTQFNRFCNRLMVKPEEEVVAKLELLYREAGGGEEDDEDTTVAGEGSEDIRVEGINEKTENQEDDEQTLEPETENEFCILCMERVREIVFLPCCHFLACPLCSPKVMNCPVCKEVVQKYLKLYWS